jgi:hypothetical protein
MESAVRTTHNLEQEKERKKIRSSGLTTEYMNARGGQASFSENDLSQQCQ